MTLKSRSNVHKNQAAWILMPTPVTILMEDIHIWAETRENLSSGFPTKRDSNQSPQLHPTARKIKFRL